MVAGYEPTTEDVTGGQLTRNILFPIHLLISRMVPPEGSTGEDAAETGRRTDETRTTGPEEWFAMSALRIGLVVIGFVVLLFALGQAVGLNLLGMAADALTTQMGRWLLVAVFGLLLIALALRGFDRVST